MLLTQSLDQYLTLVDRRNKKSSKFGDDVMSSKYDIIIIFPIYDQFGAIRKPDFGRMVCILTVS